MPQLIVAALILWAVFGGLRWFARADPKALANGLKRGAGSAALVVAALLLVFRENIEAALAAGALGAWLLGWSQTAPAFLRSFGFAGSRSNDGRRAFRSRTIEIEVGPGPSEIQGRVLAGAFALRRLDELDETECLALLTSCQAADPQGVRLLELYLDRRFPRWRAAGERNHDSGRQQGLSARPMSEDDAYEMLGLAKGASREEISRAHRTLMKKVHPDHGGTTSLAALLNQARDVLIRRHL
jgi:hypothetical protein